MRILHPLKINRLTPDGFILPHHKRGLLCIHQRACTPSLLTFPQKATKGILTRRALLKMQGHGNIN